MLYQSISGATPCAGISNLLLRAEEGISVAGKIVHLGSESAVFNPSEDSGGPSGWSKGCSGVISRLLRVDWDEPAAPADASHWSEGSCANNPMSGMGRSNELGATMGNAEVKGAVVGSLDEDRAFGKSLSKGFDI